MKKAVLFLFLISCSVDNASTTHEFLFMFPAGFDVSYTSLTIWPKAAVINKVETDIDTVREAEWSKLSSFSIYVKESEDVVDLWFIRHSSVFIYNSSTALRPLASMIANHGTWLEYYVNEDIDFLDYLTPESYIQANFIGEMPIKDVDVVAVADIYTEGTWGMACSMNQFKRKK